MATSIKSLLESASPYKSLQSNAVRLAKKWAATGLLDDIKSETEKNNMCQLLENQAKRLVTENSQTGGGTSSVGAFTAGVGEQWAGIALPLVRKVFGQIAAKEFISVQPMNLPAGLVFFLDFQYGTTKNPFTAGNSVYGDGIGTAPNNFGNTNTGGLYGAGRFGYSINNTSSIVTVDSTSSAQWTDFNFDAAYSASAVAGSWTKFNITVPGPFDPEAARGFIYTSGSIAVGNNLQAFTVASGSQGITMIFTGSLAGRASTDGTLYFTLAPTDKNRGDFEDKNTAINNNNNPIVIPEINVQMRSEGIVAKTRKLKATWSPEFAEDLDAYQSLDAEAELTGIMSEYISLEIDLEILDMLITDAAAGNEYWSAVNNQAITDSTGNGAYASLGFYNTQGAWFQTLGTKVNKLSNIIHQKTMRGGANFMVISPTVSTIIESIPGFAATVSGTEQMEYAFGVQKSGQLNGKYKVYKNPYMNENTILLGYRGSQFLECGAVFAPYIPLIQTPLVYDPVTYTPGKGLLTRYAKKMVRPEFYAKIYVSGLNTL